MVSFCTRNSADNFEPKENYSSIKNIFYSFDLTKVGQNLENSKMNHLLQFPIYTMN